MLKKACAAPSRVGSAFGNQAQPSAEVFAQSALRCEAKGRAMPVSSASLTLEKQSVATKSLSKLAVSKPAVQMESRAKRKKASNVTAH